MSEMVERVARAMMAQIRATSDAPLDPEHFRELARAAIEAMREPTEDMPFPEAIKQYWRAMIDEALK